MAEGIRKQFKALCRAFTNIGIAITGTKFIVEEVPKGVNELAYTESDKHIYLACNHPIIEKIGTVTEKLFFVKGLFAHELLHQILTDFETFESTLNSYPIFEAPFFRDVFNIMEDPAIEFQAPRCFGNSLLKSLRYMVTTLYNDALPIEAQKGDFAQFMTACIQFGDGGLLIGNFTSEEAEKAFYEALPYISACIEEKNAAERVELAKIVHQIAMPLWINDIENATKDLRELLDKCGKSIKGEGTGIFGKVETDDEDASDEYNIDMQKRRKLTFSTADKEKNGGIEYTKYVLSEEDIEQITNDIKDGESNIKKDVEEEKPTTAFMVNYKDISKKYKGSVTCLNKDIRTKKNTMLKTEYNQVVAELQGEINNLYKRLNRIIRNDTENKIAKTSGRINIKRLQSGRKTARMFDHRIASKNKADAAIMILVDISGSMKSGYKVITARKAVIALAEVFSKLAIPCKAIAFTADKDGYDVVHEHYLHWRNSYADRVKLMNIRAQENNFDGYSIRYAAEDLKRQVASHKLMIIISDGQPACRYYGYGQGVSDTANAVREARKDISSIIGLGIDADKEILQKIYGSSFVYVKKLRDLFTQIGTELRKEFEKW